MTVIRIKLITMTLIIVAVIGMAPIRMTLIRIDLFECFPRGWIKAKFVENDTRKKGLEPTFKTLKNENKLESMP